MRYSLSWLRDFVTIDLPPERLAERLTLAGFAVDAVEPFAPPCDPGGPLETVLEIDITSNRPDAMNHLGLAREIAAILGRPLRAPAVTLTETEPPATSAASVAVEAPDLCPRYVARVVQGVRAGDSPIWLTRRLEAAGIVPKNAVVDASNYVLLELGQPLHAFDLGRLAGRGVSVRRARSGEVIVPVADRTERALAEGMLIIAEAGGAGTPGRPAAIAGVMGGLDSAISETTTEVLIESAWFDPLSVRKTARALGMHTDASHRFERGADPVMTRFAADRLAALIAELAGGKVLAGAFDVRAAGPGAAPAFEPPVASAAQGGTIAIPRIHRDSPITLRSDRIEGLLGTRIEPAEVAPVLAKVGIDAVVSDASPGESPPSTVDDGGSDPFRRGEPATWACSTPSWRWDLTREVDLIEEYARLTGYDRIPESLPSGAGPPPLPAAEETEDRARDLLVSFGYSEAINYAMLPSGDDALFGAWNSLDEAASPDPRPRDDRTGPSDERFIIANPLSDRWEVMRRSLVPALARTLAFNLARGRPDLRLFEVGTTHRKERDGSPIEEPVAALAASGLATDPAWPSPPRAYDLLDLKGAVEALAAGLAGGSSSPRASASAGGASPPTASRSEVGSGAPTESRSPTASGRDGAAGTPTQSRSRTASGRESGSGAPTESPVGGAEALSPSRSAGNADAGFSAETSRIEGPWLSFAPPPSEPLTGVAEASLGTAGRPVVWPFHPGQSFTIRVGGRLAGRGGRLHPEIEAAIECNRPLFVAEILLTPFAGVLRTPRYEPLARLNPVERDLSFYVAEMLPFATVEAAVFAGVSEWEPAEAVRPSFFLLDRFEGGSAPAGKVSYAFRFRFAPRQRALTAEELNAAIEQIAEGISKQIGAEIRSR